MNYSFVFFLNSALLGVGLAMDAFSVSLANGLHEPKMRIKKMCGIAGTFGAFQAIMPMTGWLCVHTIVEYFRTFEKFIPWIALILLCYIGGSMLINGIRGTDEGDEIPGVGPKALSFRALQSSIDALSVGFTISEYDWLMALVCSLIIAIVTFFICMTGLSLGKRFGNQTFQQGGYSRWRHSNCNWSGNFYQQYVLIISTCLPLFSKYCSARCFTIQALIFTCFPIKKLSSLPLRDG